MDERDKNQFVTLLQALSTTLVAGRELSKPMILGYWLALRDLLLADLEMAVNKALRSCKAMPAPVELRELAGAMTMAMRLPLAWAALLRGLKHGSWRSVDFEDPAINATVRNLGGWARLCSLEGEELNKWTRREFEKIYPGFAERGVPSDMGMYLAGANEIDNDARGFAYDPPHRVPCGVPPTPLLGPVCGPHAGPRLAIVEKVKALAKDKS